MREDLKTRLLEGEDLFLKGAYPQALQTFEAVLEEDPSNPYALNDAGLAYAELGQLDRAVECFERALQADPGHENAFFNLIDQLLRYNQFDLAVETFLRYQETIPDSEQKRKYEKDLARAARKQWEATLNANPGIYLGEPTEPGEQVLKVAFVCGPHTKFIFDIEERLARRHHVRVYHFTQRLDLLKIQEALDWADVVWFEWCDQILVEASRRLNKTAAVVCRLHRYEVFTPWPGQVNWAFVDRLIFVAPHMQRLFWQYFPGAASQVESTVIFNGVDLDRFTFRERGPGFNLAYVGYINPRKNPVLLLQCLHRLVQKDKRYRLFVAGVHQDPCFEVYWNHMIQTLGLQDHVIMEGWVDDIDAWLEDKNFLLSTSVHESFGYNIAEAMAKGIKPVIHNYYGVTELWPREFVFSRVDDVLNVIDGEYNSSKYRDWIETKYNLNFVVNEIENVLIRNNNKWIEIVKDPSIEWIEKINTGRIGEEVVIKVRGPFLHLEKPERNLLIMGFPRSGTSLAATVMNYIPNVVVLNEIIYDVNRLPRLFAMIRKSILENKPIPNRFNKKGELTTNTTVDGGDIGFCIVNNCDENVVIGSKVNMPYLLNFDIIKRYKYHKIIILRNPVESIGSVNTNNCKKIPEHNLVDINAFHRYKGFPFKSDDNFSRQAELWNYVASIAWEHRDEVIVLRYEDLISDYRLALKDLCERLRLELPEIPEHLFDRRPKVYPDMDKIQWAVEKYAPLRLKFGYA